jgi:hypothetical protein
VPDRGGIVRDIRTGHAVGRTRSLTEMFVNQIQALIEADVEFYVVFGPCRLLEQREMVDFMRDLDACPVIFDKQMPPDCAFIFEGHPDELGFAS